MQFHKTKNNPKISNNHERTKMINVIQSDAINNVCFECGGNNPEYISINNAIFICKECVQDHFQFPHEISQIIINDLKNLHINDIKRLYLGGNKKLIEFINFDFPRLKQCPPNILYKTRAVDYYRKRLDFFVQGGIRPLKPIFEYAYQMINIPKNNFNISNYKKDLYLSPKVNLVNERYSSTTKLTPISEANQNEDENNNSEYSENKENNEKDNNSNNNEIKNPQNTFNENDNCEEKEENNLIYSPKKPQNAKLNNNSDFIISQLSNNNKSFENKNTIKKVMSEKNLSPLKSPYKKQVIQSYKNNNNSKNNNININSNLDSDKNISDFINLNNNEKSITKINDDIYGDDNTIKSINKYMNSSKESDSFIIKNNTEKDLIIKDNINYCEDHKKNIIEINPKKDEENNIEIEKYKDKNEENNIVNISPTHNNKKDMHKNIISNNSNSNDKIVDRFIKNNKIEIMTINEDNRDDAQNNINNDKLETENNNKTINYFIKDIKDTNLICPKHLDSFSEKHEDSKKKHLKAKISTKKMKSTEYEDEDDNCERIYPSNKSNKIVPYNKNKNDFFKNEANDILQFDDDIFSKNKKDNFYSDACDSNFINPLKYLKRSFQKRQEEKFGYEYESNSNSCEDEFENNNSIKLIDNMNSSEAIEDVKSINDKNIDEGYKEINRRTRNSIGKEGDTKESTESQQEEKNVGIRQRYKNRNKY